MAVLVALNALAWFIIAGAIVGIQQQVLAKDKYLNLFTYSVIGVMPSLIGLLLYLW